MQLSGRPDPGGGYKISTSALWRSEQGCEEFGMGIRRRRISGIGKIEQGQITRSRLTDSRQYGDLAPSSSVWNLIDHTNGHLRSGEVINVNLLHVDHPDSDLVLALLAC
jgi:hypothetical protein